MIADMQAHWAHYPEQARTHAWAEHDSSTSSSGPARLRWR